MQAPGTTHSQTRLLLAFERQSVRTDPVILSSVPVPAPETAGDPLRARTGWPRRWHRWLANTGTVKHGSCFEEGIPVFPDEFGYHVYTVADVHSCTPRSTAAAGRGRQAA